MKCIISQRVTIDPGHGERRDALDQRWGHYLGAALADLQLFPMANTTSAVTNWCEAVSPQLIILTGGNDLGEAPERDAAERALLEYALTNVIPLFAVCRGLQLIAAHFGAGVERIDAGLHCAREHSVELAASLAETLKIPTAHRVNSYHCWGVRTLPRCCPLRVGARSSDGVIEVLCHASAPLVAVQWHPERSTLVKPLDAQMLTSLCKGLMW